MDENEFRNAAVVAATKKSNITTRFLIPKLGENNRRITDKLKESNFGLTQFVKAGKEKTTRGIQSIKNSFIYCSLCVH